MHRRSWLPSQSSIPSPNAQVGDLAANRRGLLSPKTRTTSFSRHRPARSRWEMSSIGASEPPPQLRRALPAPECDSERAFVPRATSLPASRAKTFCIASFSRSFFLEGALDLLNGVRNLASYKRRTSSGRRRSSNEGRRPRAFTRRGPDPPVKVRHGGSLPGGTRTTRPLNRDLKPSAHLPRRVRAAAASQARKTSAKVEEPNLSHPRNPGRWTSQAGRPHTLGERSSIRLPVEISSSKQRMQGNVPRLRFDFELAHERSPPPSRRGSSAP